MQLDDPVDYLALHVCDGCVSQLRLQAYPVAGGWVAATVCKCRARGGLPLRYGTETETLPTFGAAELAVEELLNPPLPTEPENDRNIYWDKANKAYRVEFKRHGQRIRVGHFREREDAVRVRDAFMEEAA